MTTPRIGRGSADEGPGQRHVGCVARLQLRCRTRGAATLAVTPGGHPRGLRDVGARQLPGGPHRVEYGVALVESVHVGVDPVGGAEADVVSHDDRIAPVEKVAHENGVIPQCRRDAATAVAGDADRVLQQLRRGALVALTDRAERVGHQRAGAGPFPRGRRLQVHPRHGDRLPVGVDRGVHDLRGGGRIVGRHLLGIDHRAGGRRDRGRRVVERRGRGIRRESGEASRGKDCRGGGSGDSAQH